MRERGVILVGLAVFLAVATFPLWYACVAGGKGARPEIEKPAGESSCVEEKEFMTARHMELLDQWRDAVVREGRKTYVSKATGRVHEMSLTRTCMKCHQDQARSCDRCHDYAGVHPYCWDCHVGRGEK
jgi:hypothetical protein